MNKYTIKTMARIFSYLFIVIPYFIHENFEMAIISGLAVYISLVVIKDE